MQPFIASALEHKDVGFLASEILTVLRINSQYNKKPNFRSQIAYI